MNPLKYLQNNFKAIDGLLLISNIIFILTYIVLSVNNRIAHDDFFSIYITDNYGIFNGMQLLYDNWCSRYIALLISFSVASLIKYKITLILYQILLFIIATGSIYLLLYGIKKHFHFSTKKNQLLNYALFICSATFYCSIDVGQTWFWLSSNSTYLLSTMLTLGAFGIVIRKKQTILSIALLVIFALIIGGSNEALSLFCLLTTALSIIYISKKSTIKKHFLELKALLLFFSLLLVAFTFLYVGKGNEMRATFFSEIGLKEALTLNVKLCAIFVFKSLPKTLPYCLLFSIVISMFLSTNNNSIRFKKYIYKLLISFFILLLAIYTFQLPITYKTQDLGAERTLYPLTILTLLFFTYNLKLIGQLLKSRKKEKRILTFSALGLLIAMNFFQLINQKQITTKYATAFDLRMKKISREINRDFIQLKPLPNSGFLYSAEINQSPSHFTNKQLKQGLRIKGQITLEPNL